MDSVRISGHDLERFVKSELGVEDYIDLGLTGRIGKRRWADGESTFEERAEFSLADLVLAADILTDDDLQQAAEDGIRDYLRRSAPELKAKIAAAAQQMRADMLSQEP